MDTLSPREALALAERGGELDDLLARARAAREAARGSLVTLLAQGLHPAHRALPRRLPLLHVRQAPAARTSART